jgi:hypothetical protein
LLPCSNEEAEALETKQPHEAAGKTQAVNLKEFAKNSMRIGADIFVDKNWSVSES